MGLGLIHGFPDIFRLEQHREEIASMEGFGEKSADNLINAIEKARNTRPERILAGLGIPGIGVATAGVIARHCHGSWDRIIKLSGEELSSINGIGPVLANEYEAFFADEGNMAMVKELSSLLRIDESVEDRGSLLQDKVFVITGSLEHFENRDAMKAAIQAQGGRVSGSVSGKTDYLITNDPGSGSSKNRKAQELGVKIITEEEAMELMGRP